ncbi:8-amino-7-oxononanoate synthase [Macromonas bipunctata]|uniref:8-amino-7-oxononanoate synthase n=1 Tax=Macromonas bipunctata TaxID=183670 RepID=UPI000C328325|nr:8-amino-7-oxononanoate synthase [Macromonas bipunctata]
MLIRHLHRQLLELDAAGLRRRPRTVASPCAPQVTQASGQALLAFCSNDYLGLAHHPTLVAASSEGAQRWGVGSGASHLVSGHTQAHAELEDDLARWFAPHIPGARALVLGSGYAANLALMTALADGQTTIFSDKLNHASLIDGSLLAPAAKRLRYPHGALDVLERQLRACDTPIKLIVTDAVFSMDGDVADVPALLALAEAHDAWLVLDDAHGLGVLGAHGHGTLEHFGLCSERLIVMGTLGKAAGVAGAFVAAHPTIIAWLVQRARSYIYTTAMPAVQAHTLRASLALIESPEGDVRRAHLRNLLAQWRAGVQPVLAQRPDWSLPDSYTAIQPLVVGGNETALRLSAALEAQGLWVPAIRPPTVPVGTARLRITFSAAHSMADVAQLLHALADVAQHLEPA